MPPTVTLSSISNELLLFYNLVALLIFTQTTGHPNKCRLLGLVISSSLSEGHDIVQMCSKREIASLDIWRLTPPHNAHRRELVTTFARISEIGERQIVHFPSLCTIYMPE